MSLISVDQFVKKYEGKSVDFDKAYGAQCVDLFNYYNKEVVGAPWIGTPITGGARDIWENSAGTPTAYYRRVAASQPVVYGDVLVYGEPLGRVVESGRTKFYGHLRIAIGNNRTIEQNGRISAVTTVQPLSKIFLIGILRPLRLEPKLDPQKAKPTTPPKQTYEIKSGDTFWGIEQAKGIAHGTLQKLNPGVDPRNLQIGQKINITATSGAGNSTTTEFYTIVPGDTFWALEDAWSIPHGRLQQLNPGVEPRKLQIGQRIRKS